MGDVFVYFDQNYEQAAQALNALRQNALRMLLISVAIFVLVAAVVLYLQIRRMSPVARGMRLLGVSRRRVWAELTGVMAFWTVLATAAGTAAGMGLYPHEPRGTGDASAGCLPAAGMGGIDRGHGVLDGAGHRCRHGRRHGAVPQRHPADPVGASCHGSDGGCPDGGSRADGAGAGRGHRSGGGLRQKPDAGKKRNIRRCDMGKKGSFSLWGATCRAMMRRTLAGVLMILLAAVSTFSAIGLQHLIAIARQQQSLDRTIAETAISCVVTDIKGIASNGLNMFSSYVDRLTGRIGEQRADEDLSGYVKDVNALAHIPIAAPADTGLRKILSLRSDPELDPLTGVQVTFLDGWDEGVFQTEELVCLLSGTFQTRTGDDGAEYITVAYSGYEQGQRPMELRVVGHVTGGPAQVIYCPFYQPMRSDNTSEAFLVDTCSFTIRDNTRLEESKQAIYDLGLLSGTFQTRTGDDGAEYITVAYSGYEQGQRPMELRVVGHVTGGPAQVIYCPFYQPMRSDNTSEAFLVDTCSFTIRDNTRLEESKQAIYDLELFGQPKLSNQENGLERGVLVQDEIFNKTVGEIRANLATLHKLLPILLILCTLISFFAGFLATRGRMKEFAVMRCMGMSKWRIFLLLHKLLPILLILCTLISFFAGFLATRGRMKEFAVMRCMGMSKWRIFLLVVGELFLLSAVGGVIGFAAGWIAEGTLDLRSVYSAASMIGVLLLGAAAAAVRITGINPMKLMKVED